MGDEEPRSDRGVVTAEILVDKRIVWVVPMMDGCDGCTFRSKTGCEMLVRSTKEFDCLSIEYEHSVAIRPEDYEQYIATYVAYKLS